MYDLSRFLTIQERFYDRALNEIKTGRKYTHWIWFIFPQLKGLGHSRNALYYGIENLDEAKEYLEEEILRERLLEICQAVLELESNDITYIMGGHTDEKKLLSSMTLFHLAEPTCETFKKVIDKYFDGNLDEKTVALCETQETN